MDDTQIDSMVSKLFHAFDGDLGETYDEDAGEGTRAKMRAIVREYLPPLPQQTVILGNATFGPMTINMPRR